MALPTVATITQELPMFDILIVFICFVILGCGFAYFLLIKPKRKAQKAQPPKEEPKTVPMEELPNPEKTELDKAIDEAMKERD